MNKDAYSLKRHVLQCIALLLGILPGAAVMAQAVVDPVTQPMRTIAPYVLEDDNLANGGTYAYRPWFENGAFQGDIIQYTISQDGARTTDVPVGENPPVNGVENWSARAVFAEREAANTNYWQQGGWPQNRNIITTRAGDTITFQWSSLSDAQKAAVDPNAFEVGATSSPILDFVRGDRSNERDKANGALRLRHSILGDIIHSRPVITNGMVLVGANDGMLHAFDTATGAEVFAYVPSTVFGRLMALTATPYEHTYFVDGELRAATLPDGTKLVTGGLGAGGKGFFVLDVTDRASPRVLFEIGPDHPVLGDDIGYIHGRPTIARLQDGHWYVVTGNGYASANGDAKLIVLPLGEGGTTRIWPTVADSRGMSAPALVDINGNGRADYIHAGDLAGNLWRFDLANNTVVRLFSAGASKPITVEPDVTRHSTGSGLIVYVGTGSLLSAQDVTNRDTQTVYGIWDRFDCQTLSSTGCVDPSRLITQTLVTETHTWMTGDDQSEDREVRIDATRNLPTWSGEEAHLGWQVDLPGSGERLIGRPQIRSARLQFVTTNPTVAGGGESWFLQLDMSTGGTADRPLFDFDRSGTLDDGDAVPAGDHEGEHPVGRNLGAGNISQPAIARLNVGTDALYINGLLLPQDGGTVFAGDVDVHTDSPLGPMTVPGAGYPDPDDMNRHLDADGIGNRTDAHHHAYDKVHNVLYVDFFDMEPRRGQTSLMVGVAPYTVERELNRVTEISGLDPDQKFIVSLTNADLSKGTELQIGCRTWSSYDYQQMITRQLVAEGKAPGQLVDTYHGSRPLVFTLNDIENDTGCANPTLRITITDRVGRDGVLHGTLPGCVNNTHDYLGNLKSDQNDLYKVDPHVTPNREGHGYRWRNGALTLQLLAVGAGDTAEYTLQETDLLPRGQNAGSSLGFGGVYAQGFEFTGQGANLRVSPSHGPNDSGLLYESSIFWHWGDMWDLQQSGFAPVCYGQANYGAVLRNETAGINFGQYRDLIDFEGAQELIAEYGALLERLYQAINVLDEAAIAEVLQELHALLDANPDLAEYHRYRGYAPGLVPEHHLLDIDRVSEDGTPADVDDVAEDLRPAQGPNFRPGRRSWMDIAPGS
jgi:outer membrane protein assembly factor BamB